MTYSINLSGAIFFVEAEAYIALKAYLYDLHQYFLKIEDGQEILVDLQTRMAEILLSKKSKDTIDAQDIQFIINTIGNINDFEEAEKNPAFEMTYQKEKNDLVIIEEKAHLEKIFDFLKEKNAIRKNPPKESKHINNKKLFRDNKRKKLAGVIAGIAYFFKVNPLWLRLLYILFSIFNPYVSIIFYGASWILMPSNDYLPEQDEVKKIYRNEQEGIIAGICKGLSHYLGLNEVYLRIIFVALNILGGLGLILYFSLWVLMPTTDQNPNVMSEEEQLLELKKIQNMLQKYYKD